MPSICIAFELMKAAAQEKKKKRRKKNNSANSIYQINSANKVLAFFMEQTRCNKTKKPEHTISLIDCENVHLYNRTFSACNSFFSLIVVDTFWIICRWLLSLSLSLGMVLTKSCNARMNISVVSCCTRFSFFSSSWWREKEKKNSTLFTSEAKERGNNNFFFLCNRWRCRTMCGEFMCTIFTLDNFTLQFFAISK